MKKRTSSPNSRACILRGRGSSDTDVRPRETISAPDAECSGRTRLRPWALALAAAFIVALLLVPAGAQSRRFEGGDSRMVVGRVTTRGDRPIPRAIVYLKNTKSLVVRTFIAGEDGSYRFPALSPNVDYQLYAEHGGKRSEVRTLSALDSRREAHIHLRIDE